MKVERQRERKERRKDKQDLVEKVDNNKLSMGFIMFYSYKPVAHSISYFFIVHNNIKNSSFSFHFQYTGT